MTSVTRQADSVRVARPQPSAPLQPFYICGAILGGRLPNEAVIADIAFIKRQGPQWYAGQLRAPSVNVSTDAANAYLTPSLEWRAKSEWSVSFRVDALNEDEAIARVQDTLAPAVKVALESISESTVQIELLWWGLEGEDGWIPGHRSVWPPTASGQVYEISLASESDLAAADRAARAVLSSDLVAEAAREMYVAQRLFNRLDGSLGATVAALHRYFVVIERLAGKSDLEPDTGELVKIVSSLRASLDSSRGLRRSISAIDAAQSQIRDVKGRHFDSRIRATGERLGVDEDEIESAIALLRVRNATAHPGFDGAVLDVYEHLVRAQSTARTFLMAATEEAAS